MHTFGLIVVRVGERKGAGRERRGTWCIVAKLEKWAAAAAIMWAATVSGVEVGLAWGRNTEPDIAGYRVYYGSSSGAYTSEMWAGDQTSVTISNLQEGLSYYFAVTATTTAGIESAPSEELVLHAHAEKVKLSIELAKPVSQGTAQIKVPTEVGRVYILESSQDLKSWAPILWIFGTGDLATVPVSPLSASAKRFYRVVVVVVIP